MPEIIQGASGGSWGYDGRNIHFGIREHAMGAIANDMAAHGGIIPLYGDILCFCGLHASADGLEKGTYVLADTGGKSPELILIASGSEVGLIVAARLVVEAGISQGWDKYIGDRGDILCLDRFGVSAPGKVLFREFGFTAENVADRARKLIV